MLFWRPPGFRGPLWFGARGPSSARQGDGRGSKFTAPGEKRGSAGQSAAGGGRVGVLLGHAHAGQGGGEGGVLAGHAGQIALDGDGDLALLALAGQPVEVDIGADDLLAGAILQVMGQQRVLELVAVVAVTSHGEGAGGAGLGGHLAGADVDALLGLGGQSTGLLSDARLGHGVVLGVGGGAGEVDGQHHVIGGGETLKLGIRGHALHQFSNRHKLINNLSVVFQLKLDLIVAGIVVRLVIVAGADRPDAPRRQPLRQRGPAPFCVLLVQPVVQPVKEAGICELLCQVGGAGSRAAEQKDHAV